MSETGLLNFFQTFIQFELQRILPAIFQYYQKRLSRQHSLFDANLITLSYKMNKVIRLNKFESFLLRLKANLITNSYYN